MSDPIRPMQPDDDPLQHDDHIWLSVNGEGWAIHSIREGHIYVLWRGYHPFLEWNMMDASGVNWPLYTERALELLYGVNADEADSTTVN